MDNVSFSLKEAIASRIPDDPAKVRLLTVRLLYCMAAWMIPLYGIFYNYTDPTAIDPYWMRAIVVSVPIILLASTYVSEYFRRHCLVIFRAFLYFLTDWFIVLVTLNGFSPNYALGLLFSIFVYSVAFKVGLEETKSFLRFLTVTVIFATIGCFVAPDPQISLPLFVFFMVSTVLVLYIEARSHIQVQDALVASQRRFRAAVEGSLDAFYLLRSVRDKAGRMIDMEFTDANSRGGSLLSIPKEQLLGRKLKELFPGRRPSAVFKRMLAQCDAIIRSGEVFEEEMQINNRIVNASWIQMQVVPVEDGVAVIVRDISKSKEFEKELIQAKNYAEEMARLKTSLLENMSHEVRTPITAILGFAQILYEEVDGDHREFVELIVQGGERLRDTLTSVLDLARLEAGGFAINRVDLDVVDLSRSVVRLFKSLAQQKGLYLEMKASQPVIMASLDRGAMERILTNFTSNAIKFTSEGGVTINIESDAKQLRIQIQDTGIGISEEFMPHLFEEFKQESQGLDRSHEGTGLGLSITKRLSELMNGHIEVESQKGVGTTFTVVLPRGVDVADVTWEESEAPILEAVT
jgi:signal transduction histidine kinase